MTAMRIEILAEFLREHVFEVLDQEPEMTGDGCGRIAQAVKELFSRELSREVEPE